MAKRKKSGSNTGRVTAKKSVEPPTPALRIPCLPGTRLSQSSIMQPSRAINISQGAGLNMVDINLQNFGVGIHNQGGTVNFNRVGFIDCGTAIVQESGDIQGKDVRIEGRKTP